MLGFTTCFVSAMCLFVILTGPCSAGFWRPHIPSYPKDPNDPYYKAFQVVPSPTVTANKLLTKFLHYNPYTQKTVTKRQTITEDIVIVLDGSGSIGWCEFKRGKKALENMMEDAQVPGYDTKYASVTFSNSARVDFKFLPYSSAANEMAKITYPGGMTNTQAGLAEAKKLFEDPSSGRRTNALFKKVLLITDGQSNVYPHLTKPNADALKLRGVTISVVAVGQNIRDGIKEMVEVASFPPENNLYRVKNYRGFWEVVKLVVEKVSGKYKILNYALPC